MAFEFKRGDIVNIKGDRYTVIQRDPQNLIVVLMNSVRAEESDALNKVPARP